MSGCTNNTTDQSYTEDFEFKLLDGTKKKMSDYKGSYVLLDFFGVYCPPCQNQMLVLTQIYENYKNTTLVMISIDVWIASGETADSVKELISAGREQEVYLNWTFGVDSKSGTLLDKYANEGVPTLYLLDKNGNIYYTNVGYTEYSVLAKQLDKLII